MSSDPSSENRRRRVKKKRMVTSFTVGGKSIDGDFMKNKALLEFPDTGKGFRIFLVVILLVIAIVGTAIIVLKASNVNTEKTKEKPSVLQGG